jgi:hypothetical protein
MCDEGLCHALQDGWRYLSAPYSFHFCLVWLEFDHETPRVWLVFLCWLFAPLPHAEPGINWAHTLAFTSDRCTTVLLFLPSTRQATAHHTLSLPLKPISSRFSPRYLSEIKGYVCTISSYQYMQFICGSMFSLYNPWGADGCHGRKNNTKVGCYFFLITRIIFIWHILHDSIPIPMCVYACACLHTLHDIQQYKSWSIL